MSLEFFVKLVPLQSNIMEDMIRHLEQMLVIPLNPFELLNCS